MELKCIINFRPLIDVLHIFIFTCLYTLYPVVEKQLKLPLWKELDACYTNYLSQEKPTPPPIRNQ